MSTCPLCDLKNIEQALIYTDEEIIIAPHPQPARHGSLIIFPTAHHTIIEQIPEQIFAKMGVFATYLSALAFEELKAQGTNIISRNGTGAGQTIPHAHIEIIPREQEDGLTLEWEAKNVQDTLLDDIFAQLTRPAKPQEPPHEPSKDEESLLTRHLRRIP